MPLASAIVIVSARAFVPLRSPRRTAEQLSFAELLELQERGSGSKTVRTRARSVAASRPTPAPRRTARNSACRTCRADRPDPAYVAQSWPQLARKIAVCRPQPGGVLDPHPADLPKPARLMPPPRPQATALQDVVSDARSATRPRTPRAPDRCFTSAAARRGHGGPPHRTNEPFGDTLTVSRGRSRTPTPRPIGRGALLHARRPYDTPISNQHVAQLASQPPTTVIRITRDDPGTFNGVFVPEIEAVRQSSARLQDGVALAPMANARFA